MKESYEKERFDSGLAQMPKSPVGVFLNLDLTLRGSRMFGGGVGSMVNEVIICLMKDTASSMDCMTYISGMGD